MGNMNYLDSPIKTKETKEGKGPGYVYASTCMQGWRTTMEDAEIQEPLFDQDIGLFAIFDGHGGAEVAKYCERHFGETLKKNDNYKKGNYQLALKETCLDLDEQLKTPSGEKECQQIIQEANEKLSEDNIYKGDPDNLKSGCTANICLLVKNKIIIANVGDSRAVLCTKGDPVKLSEDHKPNDEKERTRIEAAGGSVANGRVNGDINLSRCIGDLSFKQCEFKGPQEQQIISVPDFMEHDITKDDHYLLLGCDGLWELKTDKQIMDFVSDRIKKDVSVRETVEQLLDDSVAFPDTSKGRGCDNISAILILFHQKN